MTIKPTHMEVKNLSTGSIIYIKLNEWDSTKNLLSEESIYREVYISPNNNNIYYMEALKNEINRTTAL